MSSSLHLIQSACFLAFYHSLRDFPRICVLILYIYFSAGAAKVFITDIQTTLFFLSIYFLLLLHISESSLDYFLDFRTFFISDSENLLLIQLVLFSMNNLKYIFILCEFEIILLSIPFTLMVLYKVIGDNGFFYIHSIL